MPNCERRHRPHPTMDHHVSRQLAGDTCTKHGVFCCPTCDMRSSAIMPPRQNEVWRFAVWCSAWAGDKPDEAFTRDYTDNYSVIYDDGWLATIEIRLGAFDHGAGVAMLIVQGEKQWVAFEGEMTLYAASDNLENLPSKESS